MNAYQLHKPDGSPVDLWVCEKCGTLYGKNHPSAERRAERCCAPIPCGKCGGETGSVWKEHIAGATCSPCVNRERNAKEAARFERATKLAADEYDGWVYADGHGSNDGYFESMDALIYHLWDEVGEVDDEGHPVAWPEYVYACKERKFAISLDSAIESQLEDSYEDAHSDLVGMDALAAAVKAFNEANSGHVTYHEDPRRVVMVPSLDEIRAKEAARGKANS